MDSLTQIVLGAACGEVALGKKLGNKAMLLGAIGGTIPDLDVIFGSLFYSNEIDKLAFHRGFMHSLLFAVFTSVILSYISHYFSKENISKKSWMLLWLLSIGTHPILDSFTPYGTQLFFPFSDYRVAFNNISVADPFYTLPFLICIITAMFYKSNTIKRWKWTKAGIVISSVYMLFTILNKVYMDTIFKNKFDNANIEYSRFTSQPTIFNNILWYGIAETDDAYYASFYSLLDTKESSLIKLPKEHRLLNQSKDLKTLKWFSNNYFNLKKGKDSIIEYSDLRYPILNPNDSNSTVFNLLLYKDQNRLNMKPFKPKMDKNKSFWENLKVMFGHLWKRVKGL